MKKQILLLVTFCAVFVSTLPASAIPAPAKSEYFETVGGGLIIDREFFQINYSVIVKIIKPLPDSAFAIVRFDNPADKKNPFIKTYTLHSSQTNLHIESDPVRGFKSKTYSIELEVYSDASKTNLITKHRQKIKSDINESHIRSLLSDDSKFPAYYFSYTDDNRKWVTGHQARNQQQIVRELVLSGEKIDNWSELISIHVNFQDLDISKLVEIMQHQLSEGSKEYVVNNLRTQTNDITYEWSHKGSGQWPAQREIRRVIKKDDAIYQLSYTVKESNFDSLIYNLWRKNILNAVLK